ncbi:DUF3048 domain-containing protein [Pseudactinotalea suaedae]|uniref:DUF3048 domain-containing protein n=1 Tax=Pseudactinotalea suaedae TaxID=1524924 RepID=UPI001F4FB669|nr:DUF3048 domain-containing protein [Pseudactinotalea suaedae]
MRRTSARTRALTAVVAALLLLVGCSAPAGNKVVVVKVFSSEPVVVDKGEAPEPAMPLTWPLTGVPTDEVAARPAMSVKIENSAAARPQTGLGAADVVWEEMVEGGITRFNAVFHSQVPEVLGPIRSLRPMDAAISAPFGGLFVFSGGQARFVSQVADTGLTMLSHDGGDAGFYRTSDRRAPHNVYGDTEAFLAAGAGQSAPPPQFQFGRTAENASALTGTPVSTIAVNFPAASPGWSWDGEVWNRSEDGRAATTADGGQITAVNVVVLRVQVRNSGARDPGGNPVPETILTGTGEATVFAGGHQLEATWSKEEVGSVMTLTTADGEPVLLAPGNVWVELVPVSGSSVSTS